MKKYEAPKADVVVFETVDVVATSASSYVPASEAPAPTEAPAPAASDTP